MTPPRGRSAGDDARREAVQNQEPEPNEKVPAAYPPDPDEQSGAGLPPSQDAGATHFLANFLTRTPILDLHKKALDIDGGIHKFRAWVCFTLELIFRCVAIVGLLAIVFFVAWKTLAPLPRLTVPK